MSRSIPAFLALLLAINAPFTAQSREPAEPYGEQIAATGADWADARPDPSLQVFPPLDGRRQVRIPDAAAREAVAELEARIQTLETSRGPYAFGLEEPLADLARQFVEQGRLAEALALYQRSLHILRINTGLASPAQMITVRAMLQLQRALGDRAALDDLYGYYYRLGWLGAGDDEASSRWQVALEYLRWQREQLRARGRSEADRALLDLHRLNAELLEQASAEEAPYAVQRDLVHSQLRNLYLIRDRVAPQVVEAFSGLSARRNPRPDMLPDDIYQDRLLTLWRAAAGSGSELLDSLAARVDSPVARAELYRDLGDWEQWNGVWQRARDAWQRSIDLLQQAGDAERMEAWFGMPRELPDNGVFWQPPKDADTSRVRIAFDVDARGRPRRIEASVLAGRDSAPIVAARELRGVRFRPRFVGMEPVQSERVVREYRVYH